MADRGLAARVLTRRGYGAITFGRVVVSAAEPSARTWRHELRHATQYAWLGCAFIPLYLLLYLVHGYSAHPFERDADGVDRLFLQ
ncbi:MAG: hypothetical protein ACRDGE_05795 [Candidatus Limnocylindria bacterium]